MSAMVVAVVLGSAFLHAGWNALAHSSKDRLAAMTLIALSSGALAAVLLVFTRPPAHAVWPYLAASGCVQALYNFGLVLAYRLGEFGRMYPLARGTSPVLVASAATFLVGQPMSGIEAAGIGVVSAGLLALAFSRGLPRRSDLPAVLAAVATGCTIATYTVIDGVAVRRAGSVLGYAGWEFLLSAILVVLGAAVIRRRGLARSLRPEAAKGLGGGIVCMTAYTLVLWAQTKGALAEVATLRETSILIGAAIAALVLKEGFGHVRIAASAGVVLGIVLIAH
jgi:drug/metabolite transporter (DMT)-like permease